MAPQYRRVMLCHDGTLQIDVVPFEDEFMTRTQQLEKVNAWNSVSAIQCSIRENTTPMYFYALITTR